MAIKVPKICRINDSALKARLAGDPQYACDVCGATAHTESTLCDPVPIRHDH